MTRKDTTPFLRKFLLLLNLISFFITACSYIVIQIQIRLEEAFFVRQHGEAYTRYKERVRRLI